MSEQKAQQQEDKGTPKIILGSMEFGRRLNEQESQEVMTLFLKSEEQTNKSKEIDSAYMYQGGKTETYMGKANKSILQPNGALIASKAMPNYKHGLSDQGIREQLQTSLSRLQCKSIDLFYLHWPDHKVNIEESLKTVNELYKAGKFKRFGLSNYASWQVAEIYYLCDKHGYVKPSVYQGMYNCITRAVEDELFPCLRRFGIAFYAYNPLAGGLLAGKHKYEQLQENAIEKGGRFDGTAGWAVAYRDRFWQKSKFDGIELIKKTVNEVYGDKVSMVDVSLRWMMKHSKLGKNDGVIMGPSTVKYFNDNLKAMECEEELDEKVVKAIDEAW
eukprot:CAMPEP_0197028074 /NCGR_PEP_ID=MMETSP1384-20130603/7864_1 /TAXON_ID=29189 /ORGANISM="Ammonia sp." /LENGTH=329 /DNA_ID=CAMNT_0042457017 /DNA_START=22 /DNA_END=1008 /DNA_ORIENTATION=+